MKKSVMLIMGLMISTVIFAQHRSKDPHAVAAKQTEQMKNVLELNDTQYAAVKGINDEYAGKFMSLRKENPGEGGQKHEKAKALKETREQEINTILTPVQQEKWKTHLAEKKSGRKQNKEHRYDRKKDQLKTSLSLSDEQVTQMEAEHRSFKEKLKRLKNDTGVSKESKAQKLQTLKFEHESAVKSILSPEQFIKWKSYRTEKNGKRHRRR